MTINVYFLTEKYLNPNKLILEENFRCLWTMVSETRVAKLSQSTLKRKLYLLFHLFNVSFIIMFNLEKDYNLKD